MIKIIAAVGRNGELGKDNSLIWNLPGDLKFFKTQTMGKTIVMGKNTFNSLPRKLPGRNHVVLADNNDFNKDTSDVNVIYSGHELMKYCLHKSKYSDVYIIGGASIYRLLIDVADELYLTEIDAEADADVYFPEFQKDKWQREVLGKGEDFGICYEHVRYYKNK